jgi:hypothetical protein
MTTHDVHVTRDGRWWMISVPDVDGLTQARRLTDVEKMAKELVAVTLDARLSQVTVKITSLVVDGVDVLERAREVREARERALKLEAEAIHGAAALAHELADDGVPVRDIGEVLGVSYQRAHQLATAS